MAQGEVLAALFPQHRQMLLEESGITESVIEARGYRSIDAKDGFSFLKQLGFSPRQRQRTWPGLYIPRFTPTGEKVIGQYRPDTPRIDTRGRPIKYETPQRGWVGLDVPPQCLPLLQDEELLLWITEGTKKADAIASRHGCAIALAGVWNFKGNRNILKEWDTIPVKSRPINIVYDSDVMTKKPVKKALEALTAFLQERGAEVSWCFLPQGTNGHKIGVDDYLVAGHTLEEVEATAKDVPQSPRALMLFDDPSSLAAHLRQLKPGIERLLEDDAIAGLAELFGKRSHWAVVEQYLRDSHMAVENIRTLRQAVADHIRAAQQRPLVEIVEYADHLQRHQPEPIQYQHDKLLPLTGVTLLGGRPKLGKSYLMLNLAIAVATGGLFAGDFRMAHPGAVLYLALEDNRQRIYSRLKALYANEGGWPKDLGFVYTSPRMDNGVLCKELEQWILSVELPRLIIIDIFARVKPRHNGKNIDIYQADYDAMTELLTLAMAYGVTVALVTHLNKNYGDVEDMADAIMGSTGMTGASSTIWTMYREAENGVDAVLYITGKDVPTWKLALQEVSLEGHKDWKALGDYELVGQTDSRVEVLESIYKWEGNNPTQQELQIELGKKRQPFDRLIGRMRQSGLIRFEKRRIYLTELGANTYQVESKMFSPGTYPKMGAEGAKGAEGAEGAKGAFSVETIESSDKNGNSGLQKCVICEKREVYKDGICNFCHTQLHG